MPKRHEIRRLAMQMLYQFDLRGEEDASAVLEGASGGYDDDETVAASFELAAAAWERRAEADEVATNLAPDWPTHRQPPVDKAIIRLAHYEMASGRAPMKVTINEAVELAKRFGSEHSPTFINGVLDKMARRLSGQLPAAQ